ncbi:MAG: gliding motility protein GldN [Flavobacteriales bacterium]
MCTPILLSVPTIIVGQSVLEAQPVVNASPVREADIMWMKRIWRRIDLRQKINYPFYFPETPTQGRRSLFDYISAAAREGSVRVYNPGSLGIDDMFGAELSRSELEDVLVSIDSVPTIHLITGQQTMVPYEDRVESNEIIQYEIKEDWFFDKQRSVMEVRIVGICPIMLVKDPETDEFRGFKRLFWINYQESRSEFAKWVCFNSKNDGAQLSFDDMLNKRIFESYIIKESNVYDRYLNEYLQGAEALIEAEEIERRFFEMEHDLWSY